jgi:PAS domain S-box-containing protein
MRHRPPNSNAKWGFIVAFLAATLVYCLSGYRFYSIHREQTWSGMESGLITLAADKVRYVDSWRASHKRLAEDVESVLFAFGLEKRFARIRGQWTFDSETEGALRAFLARNGVASFHLVDSVGEIQYAQGPHRGFDPVERAEIQDVLARKATGSSDLHRDERGDRPHLHVIAPFRQAAGSRQISGAVVLTFEMKAEFHAGLRSWPTRSRTGEVVLLRRDGDQIVILNELTPGGDEPLRLRVPIKQRDIPAVRAAVGDKGFMEGPDCRGVAVLAAMQPIPDSNWGLLVKVDRAEVYGRLIRQTRAIVLVCLLLSLLTGLFLRFLWKRQSRLSEKERMQSALEKANVQQHYREILSWSLDSYLEVDDSGRILDVNSAFCELTGYSRDQLLAMRLEQLRSQQPSMDMAERIENLRKHGSESFEANILRKDGTTSVVEGNAVWSRSGSPGFILFLRDITKRKLAEEALRESERMTREFMESVTLFAVTLGPKGEILFVNDYLLRRTGWTEEDVLSRCWFDIFVPEADRRRIQTDYVASIQSGSFRPRYENRVVGKDGQVFRVGWTVTAQASASGSIAQVTSIGEDLTERRRIQEELARTQRLDSLARLAGGVAHDFNNLLTVINGYSELLLMRMREEDPLRIHAQEIFKAGERASAMTQQLLAFGRMRVAQEGSCDANAVLCEGRSLFRHLLGEDVDLTYELAAGEQWVRGSAGQLHQVLLNLILNARDALPMGGQCLISTKPIQLSRSHPVSDTVTGEGPFVVLTLQDSGVGMPEETRKRLFEPFFTTKQVGQGTGLGLASVYGIVKQNDGYIEVHSKVGQGTRFDIYLPSGRKAAVAEAPLEAPPVRANTTILVVEDQEEVRQLESECLRSLGYSVLLASDAESALRLFEEGQARIRLVMTDVVMPGMNGAELAARILEVRPGTPILFASGYEKGAVVQSREWPTRTRFITKPFRPEDLSRSIHELLDA